jgi:hypothetical protein
MASRPVHSVNFITDIDDIGAPNYVVPAGDTCILKEMSFWWPSGPRALEIILQAVVDNVVVWELHSTDMPNGGAVQWQGWEVFTTDMYISMPVGIPVFQFRASGYHLTAA